VRIVLTRHLIDLANAAHARCQTHLGARSRHDMNGVSIPSQRYYCTVDTLLFGSNAIGAFERAHLDEARNGVVRDAATGAHHVK